MYDKDAKTGVKYDTTTVGNENKREQSDHRYQDDHIHSWTAFVASSGSDGILFEGNNVSQTHHNHGQPTTHLNFGSQSPSTFSKNLGTNFSPDSSRFRCSSRCASSTLVFASVAASMFLLAMAIVRSFHNLSIRRRGGVNTIERRGPER